VERNLYRGAFMSAAPNRKVAELLLQVAGLPTAPAL